jgi:hypothetical protein
MIEKLVWFVIAVVGGWFIGALFGWLGEWYERR